VDLAVALCKHGVPDYADARTEEQPLGVAEDFRWQFPRQGETLFSREECGALNRNASREQDEVPRPLAFLPNQLGFGHLAEHLTGHDWTVEAMGNFCVTATERHA
jgi:hypothetical protein